MSEHDTPAFAVVGHPNKGKSSIVATLAQDDSVRIGSEAGTTVATRRFPMRVDRAVMYELIDTPGFQRARRMLAELQAREGSAADRPRIVAEFVEQQRGGEKFDAECQLLTPILDGAGIIYVVDGSHPYGPEYEAEMEILRWTGQPSLALINPIESEQYVDAWRDALGQYFRIVRVFNAHTAEFYKRLDLLRAFAQLDDAWRQPLDRAVSVLKEDRRMRHRRAARQIARMIAEAMTLTVEKPLPEDAVMAVHKQELAKRYQDRLRELEQQTQRAVEEIYDHRNVRVRRGDVPVFDDAREDLFHREQWYLFGLSRKQLATLGAGAGAATGGMFGAMVDSATGFLSLSAVTLASAGVGGAMGGLAAWFWADRLASFRVVVPGHDTWIGRRLLGTDKDRVLVYGPTGNRNLPFVLLGRAIEHHARIAGRTHAERGEITIGDAEQAGQLWEEHLDASSRRELDRLFWRAQKEAGDGKVIEAMVGKVEPMLAKVDGEGGG